jgi:hypothetical protein
VIAITEDLRGRQASIAAYLGCEDFFETCPVGPFQEQPEWKWNNLIIIFNAYPVTVVEI